MTSHYFKNNTIVNLEKVLFVECFPDGHYDLAQGEEAKITFHFDGGATLDVTFSSRTEFNVALGFVTAEMGCAV